MIRHFITAIMVFFIFYTSAFGFHPAPPRRIVSLAPALTESLYLLGIGDRIKGCTTYCIKPEEAKHKEKVGTLVEINVEKVLLLKPDLVLAMQFADRKAVEKLKNLGIRVELFPSPRNFEHLCQSFLRLGRMVGREEKAKEIVDKAKKEAAFVRRKVEGEKKIKMFWQLGAKPLFSATKGYFTNDYIEYAGGINIAADAKSGIYSREEVLKRNPDVIVIVTMGIVGEREKKTWQNYSSINAVKYNRIYVVDSYKYCSPTPIGFVEALKELVVQLHPSISISSEKK
jgi:ABC-type Fe3+-hydroxamate transport system substrate-binding protein